MKISIDAGHNCTPDKGATGIEQEDILTKEVVGVLITKLRVLGHTVTDCTPYGQVFASVGGSLGYRCKIANSSGSDLHLCMHFNAGGGHGVEVYAISSKGKEYAQKVCGEISTLGYTNRGVKDGSGLFMVKYPSMPSILIEGAFVDSVDDMNRYNANDIANATVKAVTGQVPVKVVPIVQAKIIVPYPNYLIQYNPNKLDSNAKLIQSKLGLKVDGYFGNITKQAVINFQSKNGLQADGVVGQITWNKLFN